MTESELQLKRNKEKFDVVVSYGRKNGRRGSSTIYSNVINKDARQIAQVLLDLEIVDNFPIFEAVKIYLSRRDNKDWLGL